MKYILKYIPEGIFWFLYGLVAIVITLAYVAWHLKIPVKPMAKIVEALEEIVGDGGFKIVIGLIFLAALVVGLCFVFFFWYTLATLIILVVLFFTLAILAS
jgi:hypothetical protein